MVELQKSVSPFNLLFSLFLCIDQRGATLHDQFFVLFKRICRSILQLWIFPLIQAHARESLSRSSMTNFATTLLNRISSCASLPSQSPQRLPSSFSEIPRSARPHRLQNRLPGKQEKFASEEVKGGQTDERRAQRSNTQTRATPGFMSDTGRKGSSVKGTKPEKKPPNVSII